MVVVLGLDIDSPQQDKTAVDRELFSKYFDIGGFRANGSPSEHQK
jgi:hypothetical protein